MARGKRLGGVKNFREKRMSVCDQGNLTGYLFFWIRNIRNLI